MNIATFLYLKTGHNIFKPQLKADGGQINSSSVVDLSPSIHADEIHIGPRGGRYRIDARGRKVYLKVA